MKSTPTIELKMGHFIYSFHHQIAFLSRKKKKKKGSDNFLEQASETGLLHARERRSARSLFKFSPHSTEHFLKGLSADTVPGRRASELRCAQTGCMLPTPRAGSPSPEQARCELCGAKPAIGPVSLRFQCEVPLDGQGLLLWGGQWFCGITDKGEGSLSDVCRLGNEAGSLLSCT